MNELNVSCMQSDASDSPLQRLHRVVLSVANHRVADRRKLHPDLVLQARHHRNPDERCASKVAFDNIPQLSTSRLPIALSGQFLEHSFSSKVVDEGSFFGAEMAPNHREILPYRTVAEKLSNQCVSIQHSFRKEQNPRREAIDAMYHKGSLPPRAQCCRKQRPCGRGIGSFYRYCGQSGRLIEGHNGIVFVKRH